MDNKTRQLDSVCNQLKRAEKSVEDYENQVLPLSAPSFATPQKRESFRSSRAGGSSTSSAEGDGDDAEQDLRRKLAEAERKLEEKDRELKDMEVKMFENKVRRVGFEFLRILGKESSDR